MTVPMLKEQAEAEAAKREQHKAPSLTHKRWEAVHSSTRGWHVALVDCPRHAAFVAHSKARNALLRGDPAFFDLAAEALLAEVRAALAASVDTRPEGGDAHAAPFTSGAVRDSADAQNGGAA